MPARRRDERASGRARPHRERRKKIRKGHCGDLGWSADVPAKCHDGQALEHESEFCFEGKDKEEEHPPRALRRKKQQSDIRADRQKRKGKRANQPRPQPEVYREPERPLRAFRRDLEQIAETREEELEVSAEPAR